MILAGIANIVVLTGMTFLMEITGVFRVGAILVDAFL